MQHTRQMVVVDEARQMAATAGGGTEPNSHDVNISLRKQRALDPNTRKQKRPERHAHASYRGARDQTR